MKRRVAGEKEYVIVGMLIWRVTLLAYLAGKRVGRIRDLPCNAIKECGALVSIEYVFLACAKCIYIGHKYGCKMYLYWSQIWK